MVSEKQTKGSGCMVANGNKDTAVQWDIRAQLGDRSMVQQSEGTCRAVIDNHGRDADGKRKCEIAKESGRRKNRIGILRWVMRRGISVGPVLPVFNLTSTRGPLVFAGRVDLPFHR